MRDRIDTIIWLNSLEIPNAIISKVHKKINGIENIHFMNKTEIGNIGLINHSFISRINGADYTNDIIKYKKILKDNNINFTTCFDTDYPASLQDIPNKPMVIYTKGKSINEEDIKIAIVGSRKASEYGKWATEKFTNELTNLGITIVSGLALGIDTIAHKTSVINHGNTIGVLGNGIGRVYPKENTQLYKDVENNGTLLSEFPYYAQPARDHFPERNRIIAGLSLATIVIEAEYRSGTLITARHTLDQGKELFALPGNINSSTSEGTNLLIKDGCKPLLNIDDILCEIALLRKINNNNKIKNMDLSPKEKEIVNILAQGSIDIDSLSLRTGGDKNDLLIILKALILKDIIEECSSKIYRIK